MIPFEWLLYLGAVAVAIILVVAILTALGWKPPSDHDGPWSFGAVLLIGLSLAPMSPAEQPMGAGCGWPLKATIARSSATSIQETIPGPSGGAGPELEGEMPMCEANVYAAQDKGSCLPWLLPGVASGPQGERTADCGCTGDCRPRRPLGRTPRGAT